MALLLFHLLQLVQSSCPSDCLGKHCLEPCYLVCGITCTSECSAGCKYSMIDDSTCQEKCQVESCGYDSKDCQGRNLYTTVTITNSSLIDQTTEVEEKNYGKVAGVGLGVFLTIMAMILGIIICVIGTATPVFFVFLLIGILIPLITFLIVAFAPLHKDQEEKADTRTDSYFPARVIFLIFISLFAVLAIIKLFEYYVGINLKAKGVNSNISVISSADLAAPDGSQPGGAAANPLAGNLNPVNDGNNPLNPLLPLASRQNPLRSASNEGQAANPLVAGSANPLLGYGPSEHPLAPLK